MQGWRRAARCGVAARRADQSALAACERLSARQQPFPAAICLCPLSLALLHLVFDSSFWPPALVRSVSALLILVSVSRFVCFL